MRFIKNAEARVHELKSDPICFQEVYSGNKLAEIRCDDREYEEYDYIHLRQTQWSAHDMKENGKQLVYTGRHCLLKIKHVQEGYGLMVGFVALSFTVLDR